MYYKENGITVVELEPNRTGHLVLVQNSDREKLSTLSTHKWHEERGRKAVVAMNCSLFDMTTVQAKAYGVVYKDKGIHVNQQDITSKWLTQVTWDGADLKLDQPINSNTTIAFAGFGCLRNGVIDSKEWPMTQHLTSKQRRSMIGQKADKTLIMASTDSLLTAKECADFLLSKGVINAVILDGGGSTQMQINGKDAVENSGRAIANALVYFDTVPQEERKKKMKVCLDAGHAITTKGKETPLYAPLGRSIKEAEQNYPIMEKVAEKLLYNGITVITTNTNAEIDIHLSERVSVANKSNADLFVSIHKNATSEFTWNNTRGTETYCYKFGGNGEKAAKAIHKHVILTTGDIDRKVKEGNFQVIRDTKMPAVLCELGFLTNAYDARRMLDTNWQNSYATGIAKGICEYFGIEYKSNTPKTEDVKNTPCPVDKTNLYKELIEMYSTVEILKKALSEAQNRLDNLKKLIDEM